MIKKEDLSMRFVNIIIEVNFTNYALIKIVFNLTILKTFGAKGY